jgi:hypothetical protein
MIGPTAKWKLNEYASGGIQKSTACAQEGMLEHAGVSSKSARVGATMHTWASEPHRSAVWLVTAALLLALGLGWLGGSNASRFLECLTHPRSSTELAEARSYLIQTASPGYTMAKQGVELAIERLHPEFAICLTKALREARDYGLRAGIFSAYRPPAFGVGGFSDKFNSLHAYGLAVLYGIGRPGSVEALWCTKSLPNMG